MKFTFLICSHVFEICGSNYFISTFKFPRADLYWRIFACCTRHHCDITFIPERAVSYNPLYALYLLDQNSREGVLKRHVVVKMQAPSIKWLYSIPTRLLSNYRLDCVVMQIAQIRDVLNLWTEGPLTSACIIRRS